MLEPSPPDNAGHLTSAILHVCFFALIVINRGDNGITYKIEGKRTSYDSEGENGTDKLRLPYSIGVVLFMSKSQFFALPVGSLAKLGTASAIRSPIASITLLPSLE